MRNSPYLDQPLFPLADALKAGVKALRMANIAPPSMHRPRAMPDPINMSVHSPSFRRADGTAVCPAIGDDLEFIRNQLLTIPDRAWITRMGLIGFGSIWMLIAVSLLMLALMLAR
jgi:hypothetical protein